MKAMNRRSFIKTGVVGAASVLGAGILSDLSIPEWSWVYGSGPADLSVVTGKDYFKSTIGAVEKIGGMSRFVPKGAKVALLVNSPFKNYGTCVKPEIFLAVVKMCYDAGAKEISCMKEEHDNYWERSTLAKDFTDEIESLKPGWKETVKYQIPGAISMKEPKIRKDLLEYDVFINVSICKHHSGVNFSCQLKNMMGTTTFGTNLYMHMAGKKRISMYPDVDFLSQCIADLNLARKPDLCIADTTEFIINNGPWGPGDLMKPRQVVAGTDPVLIDTYCSSLMGLEPKDVVMIEKALAHGLGSTDLTKANILKAEV